MSAFRSSFPNRKPSFAMHDPDQIEEFLATKIAQAVQASPDDALLGFLDVNGESQEAVLDVLRSRPPFSSKRTVKLSA